MALDLSSFQTQQRIGLSPDIFQGQDLGNLSEALKQNAQFADRGRIQGARNQVQALLSEVTEPQFIADEQGNQIENPRWKQQMRSIGARMYGIGMQSGDAEMVAQAKDLLGLLTPKQTGLTANAEDMNQRRIRASQAQVQMDSIIQKIENSIANRQPIDPNDYSRLSQLDSSYFADIGEHYQSAGKYLKEYRQFATERSDKETGYMTDAVDAVNSDVKNYIATKKQFLDNLAKVKNGVALLNQIRESNDPTQNVANLFAVVKLLSQTIEPGMSVTEGEVRGYLGENEIGGMIDKIRSIKGVASGVLRGATTLEEAQINAATANPKQVRSLLNMAKQFGNTAMGTWNKLVNGTTTQMANLINNDIDTKYGRSAIADRLQSIKANTETKIKTYLGQTGKVTDILAEGAPMVAPTISPLAEAQKSATMQPQKAQSPNPPRKEPPKKKEVARKEPAKDKPKKSIKQMEMFK